MIKVNYKFQKQNQNPYRHVRVKKPAKRRQLNIKKKHAVKQGPVLQYIPSNYPFTNNPYYLPNYYPIYWYYNPNNIYNQFPSTTLTPNINQKPHPTISTINTSNLIENIKPSAETLNKPIHVSSTTAANIITNTTESTTAATAILPIDVSSNITNTSTNVSSSMETPETTDKPIAITNIMEHNNNENIPHFTPNTTTSNPIATTESTINPIKEGITTVSSLVLNKTESTILPNIGTDLNNMPTTTPTLDTTVILELNANKNNLSTTMNTSNEVNNLLLIIEATTIPDTETEAESTMVAELELNENANKPSPLPTSFTTESMTKPVDITTSPFLMLTTMNTSSEFNNLLSNTETTIGPDAEADSTMIIDFDSNENENKTSPLSISFTTESTTNTTSPLPISTIMNTSSVMNNLFLMNETTSMPDIEAESTMVTYLNSNENENKTSPLSTTFITESTAKPVETITSSFLMLTAMNLKTTITPDIEAESDIKENENTNLPIAFTTESTTKAIESASSSQAMLFTTESTKPLNSPKTTNSPLLMLFTTENTIKPVDTTFLWEMQMDVPEYEEDFSTLITTLAPNESKPTLSSLVKLEKETNDDLSYTTAESVESTTILMQNINKVTLSNTSNTTTNVSISEPESITKLIEADIDDFTTVPRLETNTYETTSNRYLNSDTSAILTHNNNENPLSINDNSVTTLVITQPIHEPISTITLENIENETTSSPKFNNVSQKVYHLFPQEATTKPITETTTILEQYISENLTTTMRTTDVNHNPILSKRVLTAEQPVNKTETSTVLEYNKKKTTSDLFDIGTEEADRLFTTESITKLMEDSGEKVEEKPTLTYNEDKSTVPGISNLTTEIIGNIIETTDNPSVEDVKEVHYTTTLTPNEDQTSNSILLTSVLLEQNKNEIPNSILLNPKSDLNMRISTEPILESVEGITPANIIITAFDQNDNMDLPNDKGSTEPTDVTTVKYSFTLFQQSGNKDTSPTSFNEDIDFNMHISSIKPDLTTEIFAAENLILAQTENNSTEDRNIFTSTIFTKTDDVRDKLIATPKHNNNKNSTSTLNPNKAPITEEDITDMTTVALQQLESEATTTDVFTTTEPNETYDLENVTSIQSDLNEFVSKVDKNLESNVDKSNKTANLIETALTGNITTTLGELEEDKTITTPLLSTGMEDSVDVSTIEPITEENPNLSITVNLEHIIANSTINPIEDENTFTENETITTAVSDNSNKEDNFMLLVPITPKPAEVIELSSTIVDHETESMHTTTTDTPTEQFTTTEVSNPSVTLMLQKMKPLSKKPNDDEKVTDMDSTENKSLDLSTIIETNVVTLNKADMLYAEDTTPDTLSDENTTTTTLAAEYTTTTTLPAEYTTTTTLPDKNTQTTILPDENEYSMNGWITTILPDSKTGTTKNSQIETQTELNTLTEKNQITTEKNDMMNYSSQNVSILDSSTMVTLKSDEMDATYNSHENVNETNDYNNNNDKAEQNSNTETPNPLAQVSFSSDKVDYEKVADVDRGIHTKITIPTNEEDSSLSNQTTSNLANKDSNIIWLDIKSDTYIKSFGDLNNSKHHSEIVDINTSTTPCMDIKSSADLMSTNLSLISNNSNNSQLLSNIKANKNFNELFENISSENKTATNSDTESIAVSGTSMRQTMPITHFENLIASTTNSILNENISKLHQTLTGTKISSNTNSTNSNSEQNTKADGNITTPEDSLLVSEANQQKVSKKEKPIKGTKTQHVSTPVQTDSTSVATSNRRCLEAPSQCDENLMILLAQRKTYKQPAAYFVFFLRTPNQNVFV
ncbi:uncharacterized threonine-rich GPI-anchored glycoprotein PJ4664.02-like [Teleopsis dalmanni]|uniref:uncharacterized threonine-rich GPI-anchored glycoprotein PJ4664.02-like n=1 Tax=Teleopsis dalmanni TaxID=139649 RepID=UPI0018CE473F|nr:uncharacterized threonine-rich GPI-anchored glycoprotein PJ4664.02-like [Teleopsis dalmanni]